jgi:hypothetical protein
MKQAQHMDEIDAAVNKFEPVTPDHPFYTDFKNLRGEFTEREVMRMLNVRKRGGKYTFNDAANQENKTLLFLAGMRGSGKTSELAKYAEYLDNKDCFYVITCNVDEELDMDNIQYMDVLVFQLEKLLSRTAEEKIKLDDDILKDMNAWFDQRVKEINRNLKAEGNAEIEVDSGKSISIPGLLGRLLGVTAKLKAGLSGSYERQVTIRSSLKNRFPDFALKFNHFVRMTNRRLREESTAREILFIVDGLEKTMSADTRRKIIMEESNRIRLINANTIFTLPIELMKEEQRIKNFSEIVTFPFIKICERDGSKVTEAYAKFQEFVTKRISPTLIAGTDTIDTAIKFSGGSPRQLLRVFEQASWLSESEEKLSTKDINAAAVKLGNSMARYLEPTDWKLLKNIYEDLEEGNPIGFSSEIQNLLEKEIVLEYNDGTYKRVNPLLEESKLYRHHVLA